MVSVTEVKEALEAVKGGADIVDVKNPAEGALGAAQPQIIREVRLALPKGFELRGYRDTRYTLCSRTALRVVIYYCYRPELRLGRLAIKSLLLKEEQWQEFISRLRH